MAFHLRRQQRNLDISELTPISVRGKKRTHSQASSVTTSRASTPQVSSPKPSNKTIPTSKPPSKRQRRTRTLSSLELLPAEIIANIFSYTCNINFPRASPILASKLTGEHIYDQFCKRLFCNFELPALSPLFMRKSGVHRYRCYVGSLDEEKDLVRYREMAFTCKWMTVDRFTKYRYEIIQEERACQQSTFSPGSSIKARQEAHQIELWLGENFVLPSSLLRYRRTSDRKHRSRGLDILNLLALSYPLKLDPYTDGDERCRHFFSQAIAAKDYRTVFSLVYGNLIDMDWVPELALTLASMETNDIRSMFMFLCSMNPYFNHKLQDITEVGEADNGRRQFLQYLGDQIEDACEEKEDPDIDIGYWMCHMENNPSAEVDGWNFCFEWFGGHDDYEGGPWSEFHDFVRHDVARRPRSMSIDSRRLEGQDREHSSNEEASPDESESNDEGSVDEARSDEEEPVSDWRSDDEG